MDELRKRVPFRSREDEDGDSDGRVLDEQEQEEVVEKLREQTIKSSSDYIQVLQAVVSVSVLLHLLFFVDPSPGSVFTPFFPATSPEPAIPLTRFFTLVDILVHLNLLLHLVPEQAWLKDISNIPVPVAWCFLSSVLSPALSLLSATHWQQTLWWSVTPLVSGIVYLRLKWNEDGVKEIQELERLKYVAKGA